jgi:hypothetical protein
MRPAEALHEVARIPGAAEAVTGELDVQAVLARRDQIVNNLNDANRGSAGRGLWRCGEMPFIGPDEALCGPL